SIPKLWTLAAVYERPISELVDLYEGEQLRRVVPRKGGSYDIYRKLGIQALDRREILKAAACFLGALDHAKREPEKRQQLAVAYNNVGGTLVRIGRYLSARQHLEEALNLVERLETRARILDNLAVAHYHLDNLMLAEILSRE